MSNLDPNTFINQTVQNRYQHAEKTKQETTAAIKHYPSLSPKRDKFVFNDGSEKELLNLDGTIPVKYKGSTYNIPICMWLLENHPVSSPMVYVKPTVDMMIKASRHVDQNGKVYLPYLHEWNPNSSDLMGLIQIMIMTFAEMPPVYSKPRNSSPAHFPTPYPTQPTGYMPIPGGAGSMPYPAMPPSSTAAGPPQPPTPYSPYPNPSMPSTQAPYPVYRPPGQAPYPGNMPPPYSTAGGVGGPPYPSYPPTSNNFNVSPGMQGVGDASNPPGTATSTGTITEEHIRASLISAVSHVVRDRLRDAYGTSQAEVSVLRQQQTDLSVGKKKLEGLMNKLNVEQNELDKSIRHLQEKELEIKTVMEKVLEDTEPLDIDEAVTTTAPIYKQLLHAYAGDQATQDAIYYLGEALRSDVIDLDTYLKHVRSLSRRQFQLRATMNKCRAKANLPG